MFSAFHPAVKSRAQKLIAALVFSATLFSISCSKQIAGKQVDAATSAKPASVRAVTVEQKQVRRNVESVGSLFPYEEVIVSSEVEGKVEQVLVDVGDRISKGQAIVKVSPVERQLTLGQQRATLRQPRER